MRGHDASLRDLAALTALSAPAAGKERGAVPEVGDWKAVIALSRRHRVLSMVAAVADSQALRGLSAKQSVMLRQARSRSVLAEMRLLGLYTELAERLRARGIDPLLLKGLHISHQAYGAVGVRTNRDLDFYVDEADVDETEAVVRDMGFVRIEPTPDISDQQMKRWRRLRKDMLLGRESDGAMVEIHWRLFDNHHLLPIDPGIDATEALLFDKVAAKVLKPEINLVYLAAHGSLHAWSRLKWVCDFWAMLRSVPEETRVAASNLAAARGVAVPYQQGLSLVDTFYSPSPSVTDRSSPRTRAATRVALMSLGRWGAREIEEVRWGTTLKNASHYLLKLDAAYWGEELWFDVLERVTPRHI